jgi:hypothetical protein
MKLTSLALAVALGATGCTTYKVADTGTPVPDTALASMEAWPAELEGHTLEVYTENGWANAVNLAPEGKLSIIPELGDKVVLGTWMAKGDALCTTYQPRGKECWPYKPVLAANGEAVRIESDKGQILTVRLLSRDEERLLERRG